MAEATEKTNLLSSSATNLTDEFNVDKAVATVTWADYNTLIERLRLKLASGKYSHNRPVLAKEVNPPNLWLILTMKTDSTSIQLMIRGDNLYLIGYAYQKPASTTWNWLEFKDGSTHLITGSEFLGFDGTYGTLSRVSKKSRKELKLNQQLLTDAVKKLANGKDISDEEKALYLTVLIQMVCESTRFISISDFITKNYKSSVALTSQMIKQQNGWSTLSATLLKADQDPSFIFPQFDDMGIKTAEEAVAVIGILKFQDPQTVMAARVGVAGNMIFNEGHPIVEVFSVTIHHKNTDEKLLPGNLHGTVTVQDGLGCQYIYNQMRGSHESIHPGSEILLTGPAARPIYAYDSFVIDLAIMDDQDYEFSNGCISWNVFRTDKVYDQLLSDNVPGMYGSAMVKYAVFSDAEKATVEVKLINVSDGENSAAVQGLVTAKNSNLKIDSVLFKKQSEHNTIDIKPGESIPLSKSIVAVPLESSLVVGAELHDRNRDAYQIANGTAEFPAQPSGTVEKTISGKYGEIQVKVTWGF